MPKVPFVRLFILAIVALFLAFACSKPPEAKPLISGTNNWLGYSGHHVAVGKNFFAEEGVQVKDLFFNSVSDEIKEFLDGKLDLGWCTSGDAIQMMEKDPSIKIFYLVDYSNGGDGIIGRNIKSPKDAKGKVISRENILFHRVLLRAYLEKAALSEKDVTIKNLSAQESAEAFARKEVDIAATYEPYMRKAAKQGGGEIIFSTKGTNLVADVIVLREPLLKSHQKELQAYLRAVDKAVKLLNKRDPEALKITGEKLGASAEEIKAQLEDVLLFDVEGNKSVGFNRSNPLNVVGNLDLTARAGLEFKFLSKPLYLNVENLYNDSIVQSL